MISEPDILEFFPATLPCRIHDETLAGRIAELFLDGSPMKDLMGLCCFWPFETHYQGDSIPVCLLQMNLVFNIFVNLHQFCLFLVFSGMIFSNSLIGLTNKVNLLLVSIIAMNMSIWMFHFQNIIYPDYWGWRII